MRPGRTVAIEPLRPPLPICFSYPPSISFFFSLPNNFYLLRSPHPPLCLFLSDTMHFMRYSFLVNLIDTRTYTHVLRSLTHHEYLRYRVSKFCSFPRPSHLQWSYISSSRKFHPTKNSFVDRNYLDLYFLVKYFPSIKISITEEKITDRRSTKKNR